MHFNAPLPEASRHKTKIICKFVDSYGESDSCLQQAGVILYIMYSKTYTIRWADLDANIHMRHSAYNDYAAQTRLLFMSENGFGMEWFKQHNVFPILFREETIFLKEIQGNENIRIDAVLLKMSEDGSRWSIMNHFYKEDGTLAAKLTVDGAWMDIEKRKLKVPPEILINLFEKLQKSDDFEKMPKRNP